MEGVEPVIMTSTWDKSGKSRWRDTMSLGQVGVALRTSVRQHCLPGSPYSPPCLSCSLLILEADFRYSLVTQFPVSLLYLRRCVVNLAECLLLHVFLFNSMPKAVI